MPTPNEIASNIVNALYASDPEIDASIGTPIRKVIDATAEQMSLLGTDNHLINYQYDIDSKSGGDLDDFVRNFGMERLKGQFAKGTLTFSRTSTTTTIQVPVGTQVSSQTVPPQTAQTTIGATMSVGQASVDVPALVVVPGPDGNLLANALNALATNVDGISSVTNTNAFTGGTADETDDQLRYRFKTTVFRNLAGTDSMYRAVALQTPIDPTISGQYPVSQVSVLGPTTHHIEQIQFTGGTAQSSTFTGAAYVYSGSVILLDSSYNLKTYLADYNVTVNNGVNPATLTITPVSTVTIPDGVYQLEFDYVSTASRNDPFNSRFAQGLVNTRVDLWVNGVNAQPRSQTAIYNTGITFNPTVHDPLQASRYKTYAGTSPNSGDVFTPLAWGPISAITVDGSNRITVGGHPYTQGTTWDLVHLDDAFGYTASSPCGIWWKTGAAELVANPIAPNTAWTLNYTQNNVPGLAAQNIANWRLLGTDVQVHAGKRMYFTLNLAVVYLATYNVTSVNTAITTAVTSMINGLGFDSSLEISDLLQTIHNVPGVDNVRFLTIAENGTHYGLEEVTNSGTLITNHSTGSPYYRPTDVFFDDRTYPFLYAINFVTKARNTF
jgi:uncharacterized phage protein gp47/JayE